MNVLAPILQAGIGVFGSAAALVGVAFLYFMYQSAEKAQHFSRHEYAIKIARSIWIYNSSFFIATVMMVLYLLQYYGQGFCTKPDLSIIVWLRWLFYALATFVTTHLLANVMSHENDSPDKKEPVGGDSQSFFHVLYGTLAIITIFASTISQERETQAVWIAASLALFVLAVAELFYPHDMIWGRDYLLVRDVIFSEASIRKVLTRSLPKKHRQSSIVVWSFIYRFIVFVQWVLSYIGLIITWFLADGNSFSQVADLHATMLSYLVFDALYVVPWLLLIVLTYMNVVKKMSITNRETGHTQFAAGFIGDGML